MQNASGLGAGYSDDDQLHRWVDFSSADQSFKSVKKKKNIFVAAMLRNAEKKRLASPPWYRALQGAFRNRLDAVVDPDCLLTNI
jgi:hypothetical protein